MELLKESCNDLNTSNVINKLAIYSYCQITFCYLNTSNVINKLIIFFSCHKNCVYLNTSNVINKLASAEDIIPYQTFKYIKCY